MVKSKRQREEDIKASNESWLKREPMGNFDIKHPWRKHSNDIFTPEKYIYEKSKAKKKEIDRNYPK
jgi:hypothetical protein